MHTTRQTPESAESVTLPKRRYTSTTLRVLLRLVILWPIIWLLLLVILFILIEPVLGEGGGVGHLLWASPCAAGLGWLIWQAVHRAGGRLWEGLCVALIAVVAIPYAILNHHR